MAELMWLAPRRASGHPEDVSVEDAYLEGWARLGLLSVPLRPPTSHRPALEHAVPAKSRIAWVRW
jgi:hypothetical protein